MGNDSDHAKFSPSASNRWLTCTASIRACEEVGAVSTTSSYAHEGTICHDVAAQCLKNQVNADTFRGQTIEDVLITDELSEAIQLYIDEIRGITAEFQMVGGVVEKTVKISKDCWGTLDAGMWNSELLLIADAKFGKELVSPVNNTQLKIYGIGALMLMQTKYGLTPERVILSIVQPRTPNPIRRWETTRKDLVAFYKEELISKLVECKSETATFVPSKSACRYCPLSGRCAAQNRQAVEETAKAFSAFKPSEPTPSLPPVPEGPVLDNNELAVIYKFRAAHDVLYNAMHVHLHDELMAGREVIGLKIVRGRSRRVWDGDEKAIVPQLKKIAPHIDPYVKKLKTAPAVEKEIGKVTAKKIGLPELIHKPKGTPTMVPEEDPRESITKEVEAGAIMEKFAVPDEVAPEVIATGGNEEPPEMREDAGGVLISLLSPLSSMIEDDDDDDTPIVIEEKPVKDTLKLPAKSTKRWQLIALERGSLASAAEALTSTENSIHTMLAWTHERDGCGYRLYSDNTFEIFTE